VKAKLKSKLIPDTSAGLTEKPIKLTDMEIMKAPGFTPSRDQLKNLSESKVKNHFLTAIHHTTHYYLLHVGF
jgi:hypothetical protein